MIIVMALASVLLDRSIIPLALWVISCFLALGGIRKIKTMQNSIKYLCTPKYICTYLVLLLTLKIFICSNLMPSHLYVLIGCQFIIALFYAGRL